MSPTVKCRRCGKSREVSPSTASLIRNGFLSGRCVQCARLGRREFQLLNSYATLGDRFWRKVDSTGSGCWPWKAHTDHLGYGGFMLPDGKKDKAHRVAWTLERGAIPDGLHVLHRCDNPTCCNPAHLFLGTRSDNMQDMARKGRQRGGRARLTHCKRGHARTPENLYPSGNCKVCARERARARRQVHQRTGGSVKPRLLDLFCGAGGAAMGYARAGFDVVGVDIAPQPNYPFEFVQDDALALLSTYPWWDVPPFDAIHASPPCQFATTLQSMPNARQHPNLIPETRDRLEATGLPYVIENVAGAKQHLRSPFKLCGTMFGLGLVRVTNGGRRRELHRHRWFETNWPTGLLPQCSHRMRACGIYGDHFRLGRRSWMGEVSGPLALQYGSEAMGIDWMTWPELTEAIPPAYTEFIGHQLLAHVQRRAA